MSFPYTAVLDTFNRADAATLGSAWTQVSGYNALRTATQKAAYRSWDALQCYDTVLGRNQEVYATVATTLATTGEIFVLALRVTNPTTSPDGYRVEFRQSGSGISAYLVRQSTGVADSTALALGVTAFTVGDRVGASAQGSTITVYFYDSSATSPAWAEVGSWDSATYQNRGRVGVGYRQPNLAPIPAGVYVATVSGGVYLSEDFTGRDSATQPTWTAINTGLPDDGAGGYNVTRFWVDPFDDTYQYAHVVQGTAWEAGYVNALYRKQGSGDWTEILTLLEALEDVAVIPKGTSGVRMLATSDETVAGRLVVNVASGVITDGENRIIYSDDRGATWQTTGADFGDNRYATPYPIIARGDSLYVRSYTSTSSRIMWTTDFGTSWARSNAAGSRQLLGVAEGGEMYSSINLTDVSEVNQEPADDDVIATPPSAYGHSTLTGGWGGMWISAENPLRQRILRRQLSSDATQELWQTTDAWATASKIADLAVTANVDGLYRQHLPVFDALDYTGWSILGWRTPTVSAPHTVFVYDADVATTTLGKSGSDPENPATTTSIPYTAEGIINDGIQKTDPTDTNLLTSFGGGESATAREAALRAAIYDVVAGITDAGNVYNYERWMVERDKFLAVAETDGGKLSIFWVTLDSISPARMVFQDGASRGWLRNYSYRVRGWVGLKDADATELDAVDVALQIMNALDAATALHDGQSVYDTTQATLAVIEPRMINGVLSHYVEIGLTVSDWND